MAQVNPAFNQTLVNSQTDPKGLAKEIKLFEQHLQEKVDVMVTDLVNCYLRGNFQEYYNFTSENCGNAPSWMALTKVKGTFLPYITDAEIKSTIKVRKPALFLLGELLLPENNNIRDMKTFFTASIKTPMSEYAKTCVGATKVTSLGFIKKYFCPELKKANDLSYILIMINKICREVAWTIIKSRKFTVDIIAMNSEIYKILTAQKFSTKYANIYSSAMNSYAAKLKSCSIRAKRKKISATKLRARTTQKALTTQKPAEVYVSNMRGGTEATNFNRSSLPAQNTNDKHNEIINSSATTFNIDSMPNTSTIFNVHDSIPNTPMYSVDNVSQMNNSANITLLNEDATNDDDLLKGGFVSNE